MANVIYIIRLGALPLAVVELTLINFDTGERGLALTVHRAVLEATRVRERHLETVALLIGIGERHRRASG